jgi:hypothetical protein
MVKMQGIYKCQNPAKYKGDAANIIYRSQPELKYMFWLDKNPKVIQWSSEEIIIPYTDKASGKYRRYFPDFWVKMDDGKQYIIEYKPFTQTQPPVPKKHKRKTTYIKEVRTYATNTSKWAAADRYASARNMKFLILTENDLKKL